MREMHSTLVFRILLRKYQGKRELGYLGILEESQKRRDNLEKFSIIGNISREERI
jgi:hypothetical protein